MMPVSTATLHEVTFLVVHSGLRWTVPTLRCSLHCAAQHSDMSSALKNIPPCTNNKHITITTLTYTNTHTKNVNNYYLAALV